jgi:hypothetical protein
MPPRRFPPPWAAEESAIISCVAALPGNEELGEKMDAQALIIWLIVGTVAGWLAGMVVKGGGYGLIGDIIVGIVGAFIAGCTNGYYWYDCSWPL